MAIFITYKRRRQSFHCILVTTVHLILGLINIVEKCTYINIHQYRLFLYHFLQTFTAFSCYIITLFTTLRIIERQILHFQISSNIDPSWLSIFFLYFVNKLVLHLVSNFSLKQIRFWTKNNIVFFLSECLWQPFCLLGQPFCLWGQPFFLLFRHFFSFDIRQQVS